MIRFFQGMINRRYTAFCRCCYLNWQIQGYWQICSADKLSRAASSQAHLTVFNRSTLQVFPHIMPLRAISMHKRGQKVTFFQKTYKEYSLPVFGSFSLTIYFAV